EGDMDEDGRPTSKEAAKRIADRIRALRSDKGKLHDAGLGIPVAIWDGAMAAAANIIEAGGAIADAVKAAVSHIKKNFKDANISESKIAKAVSDQLNDVAGETNEGINLVSLFTKTGRPNYEKIQDVARRITEGNGQITRLDRKEEQGRIRGGRINVEATLLLGADKSANPKKYAGKEDYEISEIQEKLLKAYAKRTGVWMSEDDIAKNASERLPDGAESHVYLDEDEQHVTKVTNHLVMEPLPENFIDNHISLNNFLSEDTAYELIGFAENEDGFAFVLKQRFIKGEMLDADNDAINAENRKRLNKYMKEAFGMDYNGGNSYSNSNYVIDDLHLGNVFEDGGNFYLIDIAPALNTLEETEHGVRQYEPFSVEISNFNQKDTDGTTNKAGMDHRGTMDGSTIRAVVGRPEARSGIHKTVEAANDGGNKSDVRDAEELEELEARGINPYWDRRQFRTVLTNEARRNGALLAPSYMDGKTLIHDQKKNDTSENDVYNNPDGKTLTKLNNLSYVKSGERHENLISLFDRIAAHNALFHEIAYDIRGFILNSRGEISLAMEQPKVDAERNATQKEIDDYLISKGFKKEGPRNWSNGHPVWSNGQYELFDARPANVLVGKDKKLYFIDTFPHSVSYMNGGAQLSNKEAAKKLADKIRALKSGRNNAYDAILGIPIALYDGMMETVAIFIEAGGRLADAVQAGVDYLKANIAEEKFTDKELRDAVKANLEELGIVPPKTKRSDTKRAINEQMKRSPTTGKVSFRDLFRKRIRDERRAASIIKGLQEEVYKHFKENGVDLTKGRAARLIKRIEGLTRIDDPAQALLDVLDDVDNIIAEQSLADTITRTNGAIKKFKSQVRKSGVLTDPYISFLKGMNFPTAASVLRSLGEHGLLEYAALIEQLNSDFSPKQSRRVLTKDKIRSTLDGINTAVGEYQQSKLSQRVEDLKALGELPENATIDDYMALKEAEREAQKSEAGKAQAEYREFTKLRQQDLADLDTIDDPKRQTTAKELAELDISELDQNQLNQLNDLINNIINDNDFTNTVGFLTETKDKAAALKKITDPANAIKVRAMPKALGYVLG
ncbi:MAG TPA: hypothetical protein PK339_16910, partial [Flavitalea sp.]|nr:hypothetical protein [Flavitalea sp.]